MFPKILISLLLIANFSCSSGRTNDKVFIINGDIFIHKKLEESMFKNIAAYRLTEKGCQELQKGGFTKAKAFFIDALKEDRNSEIIFNELGLAESHLGNYERAIENFSKALQIDSLNFGYHVNLAQTLILKEDFNQAITVTNKVISSSHDSEILSGAYYTKSNAEYGLERYDLAIKDVNSAIELCEQEIACSRMEKFKKKAEQLRDLENLKETFKESSNK